MNLPPPSAQSSIASGTDKSSSSRSTRPQQSIWDSSASQPSSRRGLPPIATSNPSSATTSAWTFPRGHPQSSSPGPGASTTSPPSSTFTALPFSAVLSSSKNLPPNGQSAPSPAATPAPFSSLLQQQQQGAQPVSSPKVRAHTPSSVPNLASATTSVTGGGGGGGTGSSRAAAFSPLSSGRTVNSPTGFPSDKSSSGAHSSLSSLTKISTAQVFLLLDSITEKEGKEKWETKASQIRKVRCASCRIRFL